MPHAPGSVRDAIVDFLTTTNDASAKQIHSAVQKKIGDVAPSSVRSYLSLNTPKLFNRVKPGVYRLNKFDRSSESSFKVSNLTEHDQAQLYHADCFDWLRNQPSNSIHAIVTDPPYGLIEYTEKEQTKLRDGKGGIWRIPPSYDGHKRSPLPRFTVLSEKDKIALGLFFTEFGRLLERVAVPGANIVIASNPLLSHIFASSMNDAGLEVRGYLTRLVMTMRGGDRPKNAHEEFPDISVMPRSMSEPWLIVRKPLEGRVQDNLRKWGTGGFRRPSTDKPFGDVVQSHPTPATEKRIAPHPSLKPQGFLRKVVRAVLPLGEGVVLDPFAGSGSTLAAANAIGYKSIGIEKDPEYIALAKQSIKSLSEIKVKDID